MKLLLAAWLQATPDIRNVSWWLPHGPARDTVWTLVLVLNVAVLAWLLHKLLFRGAGWSVPQALRERGEGIRAQMQAAERAQQEAQARLQAIEARIAGLPQELAGLAREAEAEAAGEYRRLVEASERDAERILNLGRQEIEAAAKLAQKELKGLAATLAVELAGQRIRERLTPEQDAAVVEQAVASLKLGRPN
ncbi:MAG TPA: ATP synthase F0 subunit B [Terriglobales bacterium]|nr:ATP synthase F0 subunit B [Terriglobales bacterium]